MGVQMIINQKGPLPISALFNSIGDTPMYLEVQGSVWTGSTDVMTGINIDVDGQSVGTAYIYSNGPSTHRAVVPAYIPLKLGQGQHKLTLSAAANTVSDYNDHFTAVIHY
jgi:hypothetical protein